MSKGLESFIADLIGVPWKDRGRTLSGFDCWGVVYHTYKYFFNTELERYDEYSLSEQDKAIQIIMETAKTWKEVPLGNEHSGDVVLFHPCHIGLVVRKGYMVHCLENLGTVIQRYTVNPWKDIIEGFYRYE